LKNFDYSRSGYYFVTICTRKRIPFFGKIINNNIILNEIGNIVKQQWLWLEKNFKYVKLDDGQLCQIICMELLLLITM